MARGKQGETLQAVEINEDSFIGIANKQGGAGTQVHLLEDGDISFIFPARTQTISGALAGMDYVAGPACTGITSTALVILS